MLVLGIDPGLATVGYGLVEEVSGRTRAVEYGCIRTRGEEASTPERLGEIYTAIVGIITRHNPSWLAMERLFFSRNITSAMVVSEVRGVIALAAHQHGLPLTEYTPNQVKQAITGSGRADKRQVQEMITRLLHLPGIPRPDDAADGLSLALCHIHTTR